MFLLAAKRPIKFLRQGRSPAQISEEVRMRRLTVAVMLLGCLAVVGTLLMPTAPSPISTTVSARAALHPCTQSCSFAESDATDNNDHYSFCHVDRSGSPHIICPDSSSIDQHLANHFDPNTGVGDFCIETAEDIAACGGKVCGTKGC